MVVGLQSYKENTSASQKIGHGSPGFSAAPMGQKYSRLIAKRGKVTQMRSKKTTGIVLLVAGIVVLVLSLIADAIGIGGSAGFGPYQIVGIIVGAIATVTGLVLALKE